MRNKTIIIIILTKLKSIKTVISCENKAIFIKHIKNIKY